MKMRRRFPERFKWRMNDRLPGQTLKRKKWIYASIVLICATFDVLLLFIANNAISPLLEDAPYLPQKYAQEYTHLATFRAPSRRRYREAIDAIAFSPNGQTLAAGGYQEVHLWDVGASNLISTFKEHQGWIKAIAFSPDGKTVASVSGHKGRNIKHPMIYLDLSVPIQKEGMRYLFPHTIRLWDVKTGTTQLTFPMNTLPITALEFSPDSTKLLAASQQGFIDVYDSATGHHEQFSVSLFVYDAILKTYRFNALAFSTDGEIFATGGQDREIRPYDVADAKIELWNADNGNLLHTFNSPGGLVRLLVFSPDGKTLASNVGKDWWNKIFIWDLENYRLLSIINEGITAGNSTIKALQFAPDSITLASAHVDGTVHLWDITGRVKKGKHMIENEGRKELKQ